ncbi:hypothetical protein KNCP2_12650 [Candidatus Rickettsia kedanie]|uniref:Uncharacterized protein n=1 Tax=Candidatus Rickettsia kedanie TaxID=3115352 RepID=A0ABP9TYD8_9RICK
MTSVSPTMPPYNDDSVSTQARLGYVTTSLKNTHKPELMGITKDIITFISVLGNTTICGITL